MSVLFLQSPYSYLFKDIGKSLEEKNINTFYWIFNQGDKVLYKGLNTFNVHKNVKKYIKSNSKKSYDYRKLDSLNNYYTQKLQKHEKRNLTLYEKKYFLAYMSILEDFIISNDVKFILCQNDTRWQHDLAKRVADKLNIKVFVFELGLFRPNTITIDSKGVNYNNSVPREPAFYENYKKESFNLKNDTTIQQNKFKRDLIVAKYIFAHTVGKVLKTNSIENKDLNLFEYISRFYKSYILKKREELISLPQKYIFVPFQVNDDSQILVHSNFHNITEFIETVINGVDEYNLNYKDNLSIVFKEHPMDIGKVNYEGLYNNYRDRKDLIFLKSGDVSSLISKAEAVITINSTVGLEAIEEYKPVICMGNAFYCISGIASFAEPNNLHDIIYYTIKNGPNKNLIENFLKYLKHDYQFFGDEYFYDDKVVENIVEYLLNY
jgi:capsular polysaccharide export protein